jgi:CDP-diacylglycerol--serine O-phosphatidyltransferase
MIGFYNYSVILTYIGLGVSVFGIKEALVGMSNTSNSNLHFMIAILCLAISGICDTFDGKIARRMKNRSIEAEYFGVQIDSLCDCVCFGIFPAIIAYSLGMRGTLGSLILVTYILGAIIRLAFFNVQDTVKRTSPSDTEKKTFRGLPVTSMAIIFPFMYLFRNHLSEEIFVSMMMFVMLLVAILFVLDFKLKKPSNLMIALYIVVMIGIMIKILDIF